MEKQKTKEIPEGPGCTIIGRWRIATGTWEGYYVDHNCAPKDKWIGIDTDFICLVCKTKAPQEVIDLALLLGVSFDADADADDFN